MSEVAYKHVPTSNSDLVRTAMIRKSRSSQYSRIDLNDCMTVTGLNLSLHDQIVF